MADGTPRKLLVRRGLGLGSITEVTVQAKVMGSLTTTK